MGMIVDVRLDEREADASRIDALHRNVREELRHVDDLEVATSRTVGQAGTRAVDVAALSSLAIAVLGSGGLTALVATLRGWLAREHGTTRTVRLEIDGDVIVLRGASSTEEQRLLDLFLRRHEEPR
jgi:hypothetical protein